MANTNQMNRIPHLTELETLWMQEAEKVGADSNFCLRMATAQREAIQAIQNGTREELLAKRFAEYQGGIL